MKPILIVAFALLTGSGCKDKSGDSVIGNLKVTTTAPVDSSNIFGDSSFHYLMLNIDLQQRCHIAEINYYTTGNEKYYKQFYRLQDEKVRTGKRGAYFNRRFEQSINKEQ